MEEPAGPVLKKTEINSLAIQSRKALLLKGEKEAKISNAILHKVITSAIPEPVGGKLISLVNTRDKIPDLLKLDHVIGLLIPRGSNKLASQIKESTKIPVLGHTDGICHVHVEKSANLDMAKGVFLDAKIDYPAACNAMDSSGILWDNESLAGLLALEIKPDYLFLLSVDLKSKLIHTYVKEKHQGEITFGDKSRVGRGGATATVNAAVCAAYGGFPVVITCYATDNIKEVLRGDPIGTVFHRHAHLWTLVKEEGARDMAVAAQESPRQLRAIGSEDRRNFLLDLADALDANEGEIIAEKEADVAAGYEKAMISRLALKPWKISALAKSISKLANSEQPFGRALKKTELGVTSVTESVFRDDAFQKQISEAAESLKKLRAVAIFIENNAVGTGKAPYEGLGYQDRKNILLDAADALSFHCASGSDGQTRGQGGMRQVAAGARGNRGGQGRKRSREDAQGGDRGKGRGRGQGAPACAGIHGGPSKGRGILVYKLELFAGTVWMNECRNVGNLFASIQALRRVQWCDHMDFHMLDGTTFDEQGVVNAGWDIVRRNLIRVEVTSEADVEFDYGAAAVGDDVVRVTVKRELLENMEVLNAYLLSVSYMKPTDCYRFWCGQLDAKTIVYTFQVADPDGGALENLDRNDFNHRTTTQDDWYEVVGRRLRRILARW